MRHAPLSNGLSVTRHAGLQIWSRWRRSLTASVLRRQLKSRHDPLPKPPLPAPETTAVNPKHVLHRILLNADPTETSRTRRISRAKMAKDGLVPIIIVKYLLRFKTPRLRPQNRRSPADFGVACRL